MLHEPARIFLYFLVTAYIKPFKLLLLCHKIGPPPPGPAAPLTFIISEKLTPQKGACFKIVAPSPSKTTAPLGRNKQTMNDRSLNTTHMVFCVFSQA